MPSKQDHVRKADENAAFALSLTLDNQTRIDWALIILFYSALHYVEAYLATLGQHLKSHRSRDSVVGRDPNLKKIFPEYQDLTFYGYNARYEMYGFTSDDVTKRAAKEFAAVKTHLKPLL